jgi:hypothetical protein
MGVGIHVEKIGTFEPAHLAVWRSETHRARARSRSKGGAIEVEAGGGRRRGIGAN